VFTDDDGSESDISCSWQGIVGSRYGYVALEEDYNTIFGVIFDHEVKHPDWVPK
jgi:Na+-transporting NADH:ubiquinone oxidoreductase subunit NqrC